MQQGRGKIEWRLWRLFFGSAKSSIVGEIERSIDSGRRLLSGRRIRGEGLRATPVFRNDKPGDKARGAQGRNGGGTRRTGRRTAAAERKSSSTGRQWSQEVTCRTRGSERGKEAGLAAYARRNESSGQSGVLAPRGCLWV